MATPNKPVHANNVPTPTGNYSRGQVAPEQVRERAAKLWRERNQPSGQDEAIWLEAEAQLKAESESKPVAGTTSRPNADEPGIPLRSKTKVADPSEAAAQTRSATEQKRR